MRKTTAKFLLWRWPPIELETLELIRSTYESTKIKFAWQQNDLLLLEQHALSPTEEHIWVGERYWLALAAHRLPS